MSRLLLGALPALLVPALAHAESPRDQQLRLRAVVMRANQAYQAGRFQDALPLYQQALRLQPHPPLLYRLAQTRERLGDLRGATADYERYLTLAPDNPNRPKIEAHIERLRRRKAPKPSRLIVSTTPTGAAIWIDGERQLKLTPATIALPAGDYTLRLSMDGRQTLEEIVSVPAGGATRKTYKLQRKEPVEPQKDPRDKPPPEADKPKKGPPGPEPYVLTRVDISPPAFMNNLAWTLALGGTIATVFGIAICTYDCNDFDDVLPLIIGVGALGAGSYLLFFHDWTGHLPQAQRARRRTTRPVGVSLGWTF